MSHTNGVSAVPTKNSSNGWQRTNSTGVGVPRKVVKLCGVAWHPHMVLMQPPPLPATARNAKHCGQICSRIFAISMPYITSTLGLWLDGSIIVPIACRRHIGSRPILIADCVSLLAERFVRQIMAQSLMWLMLSQ